MEKTAILQADFLDIIFEGRNKEYGAYELRRNYNKRLRSSIAVMLLMTLLLFIGQLIAGKQKQDGSRIIQIPPDGFIEDVEQPVEPPPVVPPPPPPPKQIQTIQFTTPKIVDKEVPEDEKPPEMTELENVKIDVKSQEGDKSTDIVEPPVKDVGRGIVEKPKMENEDVIFRKVEIDASYPGGMEAWKRFLLKNLRPPQEAIDIGISGTVIVEFIVDKEGNVSKVEAVSGPEELRAEAVRVIKKSGKWTPAIQNGNQVPSYKKQPIGFTLIIE